MKPTAPMARNWPKGSPQKGERPENHPSALAVFKWQEGRRQEASPLPGGAGGREWEACPREGRLPPRPLGGRRRAGRRTWAWGPAPGQARRSRVCVPAPAVFKGRNGGRWGVETPMQKARSPHGREGGTGAPPAGHGTAPWRMRQKKGRPRARARRGQEGSGGQSHEMAAAGASRAWSFRTGGGRAQIPGAMCPCARGCPRAPLAGSRRGLFAGLIDARFGQKIRILAQNSPFRRDLRD